MALRNRRAAEDKAATSTSIPSQSDIESTASNMSNFLRRQPIWIILAVASGSCAAINGVFAKLTTTTLTSSFASHLASFLGLAEDNTYVNVVLRAFFFGMNIVFNIIMWALFTAALTRSNSTTRVSIVNVSANFFITAIMGWLVFSESLPALWWLGAAFLAAGNVVIGAREEADKPGGTVGLDETRSEALEAEGLLSSSREAEHEADLVELEDEPVKLHGESGREQQRLRTGEAVDAPIQ